MAEDGEIRLWDLRDDTLAPQILPHPRATVVAFSRNGTLASGGADLEIRLWRPSVGSRLYTGPTDLTDHRSPILSLAFSEDGQRLYAGSSLPEGEVSLWDINTQTRLQRPLSAAVVQTRLSPTVLAATAHRSVTFWSPRTFAPLGHLQAHDSAIRDLALSADGRLLATIDANGVRLWDAQSRVLLAAFAADNPQSVLVAVDELLVATEDGILRLPFKRSVVLDRAEIVLNGDESLRPLAIDSALEALFIVYQTDDPSKVRVRLQTPSGVDAFEPQCDSLRCWGLFPLGGPGEYTLSAWHPRSARLSLSVSGRLAAAAPWLGVSAPQSLTYSEPFLASFSVLAPLPTTNLTALVSLLDPNGHPHRLPVNDDGIAPDPTPDDGLFSLAFADYQYGGVYALEILTSSSPTTVQTAAALSPIGPPSVAAPSLPFSTLRQTLLPRSPSQARRPRQYLRRLHRPDAR